MDEREKISSPFPDRFDPVPSFALFRVEGELLWKDFGRVGKNCGDCISFVSEMYGISRQKASEKIYQDFIGKKGVTQIVRKSRSQPKSLRVGGLRDWEEEYWSKFHLTKEDLHHHQVYSNRGFWSGDRCLVYSREDYPSYCYMFSKDSYKVYTPNTERKFYSQNIADVVEGESSLQYGGVDSVLVMCSGKKDSMTTWKTGQIFGRNIQVINPTTERAMTAVQSRLNHLINRYPVRYSLLDFDSTGWKAMRDFSEHFQPIYTEPSWNGVMIKDVAEIVEHQGVYTLWDKILRWV